MARLFIAISLSEEMKKALGKAEMMVKKVSLMKSEIKNGKVEYREI